MQFILEVDAMITLMVVFSAIAMFLFGKIPPEMTGLLSVGLLILTGILNPGEALAGFGSPALITLMGLFGISSGVFRSGALDSLLELIGSESVQTSRRIIILFTTLIAPLSALIPNTPIVSTLLPVIEGWCRRRNVPPSKVLLPFSFATVLGGTLTLLGSSVNLLASDVSEQLGYGGLELFSLTSIGIPIWILGSLYLIFAPSHWLVDRSNEPTDEIEMFLDKDYITEVVIPHGSKLIGQAAGYNRLHRRFDIKVLSLQRKGERLPPTSRDKNLMIGDRMLIKVAKEDLFKIRQEGIVRIATNSWKLRGKSSVKPDPQSLKIVEVLVPSDSPMVGATLQELRFRERYEATVLGLQTNNLKLIQPQLGTTILREGDLLLLEAPLDLIRSFQASKALVVIEEVILDPLDGFCREASVLITLAVIILPAMKLMPLVASVLLGTVGMVATGCIPASEVHRSIRLDVVLLLGSLASFSTAIQQSGLSTVLAQFLINTISGWPVYGCLALVFFGTTALTEVMSNAATVALLIPIAAQLAIGLNVIPMAFIYAVIFGASQCFLSPVGYQTNLMVFGPGRYRFFDITRYGAPLTIMMTLEVPWLICHYFSL
uniref:Putative sodium/sulfate transporter, DASS family protein n=1 Tax=Paulinella longichromatophora TaxID=1708747 RepID=A0A2H4ZQ30_9EUKA|nr:putative sodium/sulfate transporter, DASS family protein [Paulinella longichromatophora]